MRFGLPLSGGTLGRAADLVLSPLAHERVTRARDHRPWPLPSRSWVMAQTWSSLLFAHWSLEPEALSEVVPPQLPLDTFEGRAWLGVTPFEVRNLRLRPTLPVPLLSAFPEINVRTYVVADGKPGVFFFSLDAGSSVAVAAARRLYRLPYFRAEMAVERHKPSIRFTSHRRDGIASFAGRYSPLGERFTAAPGSLERWLTERYCLYTVDGGRAYRAEIHHPPWPLQAADAEIEVNTMARQLGLELAGEPLLHYSARQDVVFWGLERVGTAD